MESAPRTRQQIAVEAVDWFLKFQETAATEADRQSFSEWLLRSAAHVEEYLRVASSWSLVNVGAEGDLEAAALVAAAKAHHETDNVVALPSRLGRRLPPAGSESGRVLAGGKWRAVALLTVLVLGIVLWVTHLSWTSTMTLQTVVGQQSSFTLQDGSVVFLNTDSKVRVRWLPAQRHIELVRGEARFKVARDASRPFTVVTATATVRALGTVFNVRFEPLSTQVAVLEGQVELTVARTTTPAPFAPVTANEGSTAVQSPAIERVRLAAGERAAVTRRGIQTNSGPPIESVMSWTERRLVFRDQPLAAVIQEFNRYRMQPLVLDDPALATLRISGVFDLNDPESLIAYLGTFEAVQVDRHSDGSQHLFRGFAGVDARK
jgi:transmembrane sensor